MISSVSASLNPAGASLSELSICNATSAKLRAGREAAPAKITSSMPPPRMAVGRFSPMTQRSASSRFDLPQPLGPTTPVRPCAICRSVGSTKLLKPVSLSLVNCKGTSGHDSCVTGNVTGGRGSCQLQTPQCGWLGQVIHKIYVELADSCVDFGSTFATARPL